MTKNKQIAHWLPPHSGYGGKEADAPSYPHEHDKPPKPKKKKMEDIPMAKNAWTDGKFRA